MPLPLHILWLLALTFQGAREQVHFDQRHRPATIHIPLNQVLFGLLALYGIPSLVATALFFPSWTLLYGTSPEMLLPTGWSLVLGVTTTVSSAILLWGNYRWVRRLYPRSKWLALTPTLLGSVALVVGFLMYPNRFLSLGTYNDFWAQRAIPIWDHPYFWSHSALAIGTTFVTLQLWRRLKVQTTG